MAGKQQARRAAPLSNMTALRLLRANMGDKKGTKPVAVEGFGWDEFGALLAETHAPPPPGAKKASQIAAEYNISLSSAEKMMRKLAAEGKMECARFKDGGNRPWFFWPKKTK